MPRVLIAFAIAAMALLINGCQSSSAYRNSSVMDYLYPESEKQVVSQAITTLRLPLKVGIAFTPDSYRHNPVLSESQKLALLDKVSASFQSLEFVSSIEVIPSAYLKPRGSFQNLDQIQRMFNVDVIALVSFDQTRFTEEGVASLAYWTLVGAYIIPAEKNATHTLLDAALYDIQSRSLLFRAPGLSTVDSRSTLVNLDAQVREDSAKGFDEAGEDLITNLELQLARFKERIKSDPAAVTIEHRPGYTSGGSSTLLLLLAVIAFGVRLARRSCNSKAIR
ncbi:rhombotarget lipoprotein [Endozoicomonadaceae bacterium StTr2]